MYVGLGGGLEAIVLQVASFVWRGLRGEGACFSHCSLTLMAASTKGEVALLTTPCSSSLAATMVLTCGGKGFGEPDVMIRRG